MLEASQLSLTIIARLQWVGSTPSRWRDCDLRDGHDSRSRWVWLFDYPVGEETGKTILRHDPPSSTKCWGLTYLTRHQPPAIKGVAGWSARRIRSAIWLVARCQGRCRLVGLSLSLCHAANRPLSGALQVGRPVSFALLCGQPCCHAVGRLWSSVLWIGRDFRSSNYLCRGRVSTQCASNLATL
ncbi:hypothetical protein GW17_00057639 [Ensete ventricosum]|nr:hypothetical protein GW17_00057639 [Ensete ventricosum]